MPHEPPRKKAEFVSDESVAALIRAFMSPANPKWEREYSPSTRATWGRELRHMSRPELLGGLTVHEIRPSLVLAYFDGIADRPGKSAAGLAALKQLEKWAIVRELLPRQITLGVEIERSKEGHVPWTDEQVLLGETHARPDMAQAITLAANTGQRGSDLIRIGWTDIETIDGYDGIQLTQQKTGRNVWVPITSPLAAAMKTWERRPGPFLRKPDGAVWERTELSNAWAYQRDTDPALKALGKAAVAGKATNDVGLVLHGLRGTACVRLRRASATAMEIADMVGMSVQMVEKYCRLSAQRENAVAAVIKLERTIGQRKIDMTNKRGG
jgi:integrase